MFQTTNAVEYINLVVDASPLKWDDGLLLRLELFHVLVLSSAVGGHKWWSISQSVLVERVVMIAARLRVFIH